MNDTHAMYDITISGDEYEIHVDRSGDATCLNRSAMLKHMRHEDPNMLLRASNLVGDAHAHARADHLHGEFSFAVKLPQETADLIWVGWDRVDLARPETEKPMPGDEQRYAMIDGVLRHVIDTQAP